MGISQMGKSEIGKSRAIKKNRVIEQLITQIKARAALLMAGLVFAYIRW